MKNLIPVTLLCLASVCTLASSALANGRIVVTHDEWTLSNQGFTNAPSAAQFARNVANWFTGGAPGHFLVRSGNFGLTGTSLSSTMTAAGHTWTISVGASDALSNLQQYDAVFVCGTVPNLANLTAYVQGGGCVYLAAGTASSDANTWDAFVHAFGLDLGALNNLGGTFAIASSHPLFQGVTSLYHNNGNDLTDLEPANPANQVLVSSGAHGLYAVYDGGLAASTYCTAKTNSLGCVPAIASSGAASVSSASPFDITASNVLNQKTGLLFYGYSQQISAFQGGFKCMASPTHRTPTQNSNGNALPANDCSGAYSFDFNAWIQGGNDSLLVAGQEVDAQFWSRDPASPSTTGLTDALTFVINP
jgi:hypothetical protein